MRPASKSLPGTTKAKLAPLLHATHWQQELPCKDPKVLLAAKLGPRGCTLQERFPGASAQAQSQKQAQSGCWLRPRISSSMVASWHWKCKSSKPTSVPNAGISLVDCHFAKEQLCCWILLRSFLTRKNFERKKQLAKTKFCCTSIYVHRRKHVLDKCF
jgi:hypothetical protein